MVDVMNMEFSNNAKTRKEKEGIDSKKIIKIINRRTHRIEELATKSSLNDMKVRCHKVNQVK